MTHSWLRTARMTVPLMCIVGALLLSATLALAQAVPAPANEASSLVAGKKSHLFGGQYDPRSPKAVPAAIKPEWAGLIGEYGLDLAKFYVLEDSGELKILAGWFELETLTPISEDIFQLPIERAPWRWKGYFSAQRCERGDRRADRRSGLSAAPLRCSRSSLPNHAAQTGRRSTQGGTGQQASR
jgi:hypothetical protein